MNTPPVPPNPPATTSLERKAVALLTGLALIILSFVLYVMFARGVFEHTQQLVLLSDDSEGVIVGMDMTFSGFPIARVGRIELADDGKVRIVMEVPYKDAKWLRSSSIFTLERGMVGDTRIRAFSGILSDPPLPANAVRSLLRGDMAAEIPRLVASVRALLENMEGMTGANSSLNTSLANLKTLTARLTTRHGLMAGVLGSPNNAQKLINTIDSSNTLLKNADSHLFGKGGVADDTQATLKVTQATLGSSQTAIAQLTALLTDTRSTLTKVDAVLAEAQAVGANTRVATADLGILRTEVEANLRQINLLTQELNRKWPFARDPEIKLP